MLKHLAALAALGLIAAAPASDQKPLTIIVAPEGCSGSAAGRLAQRTAEWQADKLARQAHLEGRKVRIIEVPYGTDLGEVRLGMVQEDFHAFAVRC